MALRNRNRRWGAWEWGKKVLLQATFWGALLMLPGAIGAQDLVHVSIPGGLQGKTCYECHIKGDGIVLRSEESPVKYGISSAFLSYLESPHGRFRRLGDARAPMCEDCHLTQEWSDILPQQHPDSPIHPSNLPLICAKCHGEGMLTANVAEGSMHLELSYRSVLPGNALDVRYGFLPGITKWENTYYFGPFDLVAITHYGFLVLAVGVLGVMTFYVVLDLIQRVRYKRTHPESGSEKDKERVHRFDLAFIIQHIVLFTSVLLLIVSGVPLKFPDSAVAKFVIDLQGGMEARSYIHRIAGLVMIGVGIFHFIYYLVFKRVRPILKSPIMVTPRDLFDFVHHLGYIVGLKKDLPPMGRFTWFEKLDYIGLMWGFAVMGITGLVMFRLDIALQFMPLAWFQVLWAAHSEEAMLATLFLLVVHMYHVHFNPDVFPMTLTWLTGKISRRDKDRYHPLEKENPTEE